jgi:transposase InsO family protein
MMTCSTATGCACFRSLPRSVFVPPVGRWGCTTRPTTAGRRRSTVGAWRRCGRGSGAGRGCRTSSGRTWSSGCWPFRWRIRVSGPKRISAELRREKWGGLTISATGIWRVLKRHGLNTRQRRLGLIAGYAAGYERKPAQPEPQRHIEASRPGEIVGLDCFYVGRLSGTKGTVWQYTAIDIASGFAWAELHTSARNPVATHCSTLVARVARELAQAGWQLQAAITDNGSEYRSRAFTSTLDRLGIQQRRIRAGRPTSNGHVERLQQTILEECWRPSFARSLVPKLTALAKDLQHYLAYYNFDRAHTGRLTNGRIPGEIVHGANKMKASR